METGRVERLLGLIQALQSGRPSTAEELAASLGVKRRTLFRDLKVLTGAGLPFEYDRKTKTYSTARRALLPPVSFTPAEALALCLILRTAGSHPSVISQETTFSAVAKIEGTLPTHLQDHCRPLMENVSFRHAPSSETSAVAPNLPLIQSAIAERWPIQMRYDSFYEKREIEDVVEPYHLAFIHRAWYLIGRSREATAIRTFKVERVIEMRLLGDRFTKDCDFSLDRYFGNAWSMIRGSNRYHVKIRFLNVVAGNVNEVIWHKTQRTLLEPDGSLLFEVDVDGITEIAWWVLGYGNQAQVLEPAELIEIILKHVQTMSDYYRKGTDTRVEVASRDLPRDGVVRKFDTVVPTPDGLIPS